MTTGGSEEFRVALALLQVRLFLASPDCMQDFARSARACHAPVRRPCRNVAGIAPKDRRK